MTSLTSSVSDEKLVEVITIPKWFLFATLIPIWLSAGVLFAASSAVMILALPYVIANVKGGPLEFWLNLWSFAWQHGELGIPASASAIFFIWRQWSRLKTTMLFAGSVTTVLFLVNVAHAVLNVLH